MWEDVCRSATLKCTLLEWETYVYCFKPLRFGGLTVLPATITYLIQGPFAHGRSSLGCWALNPL